MIGVSADVWLNKNWSDKFILLFWEKQLYGVHLEKLWPTVNEGPDGGSGGGGGGSGIHYTLKI